LLGTEHVLAVLDCHKRERERVRERGRERGKRLSSIVCFSVSSKTVPDEQPERIDLDIYSSLEMD